MGALISLEKYVSRGAWVRAWSVAATLREKEDQRDAARRAQRAEWTRQAAERIARNPSPPQPELF